jgi:large subunit ribosomal protein L15
MELHELSSPAGARREKRRVGRGHGSGRVKTSGRGTKGQNARAGKRTKLFFEGGQNPWTMKVPHKRGFNIGRFRKDVQVVNLRDLERVFDAGEAVTLATLAARGLIRDGSGKRVVKLLGDGRLRKPLLLEVHEASKRAREAITSAGGSLTLLAASPDSAAEPAAPPVAPADGG